ncbi:MAG: glycerol-3-phosphate 1-O-acyltransferase PlsY [Clostridiales bacterium]|nr:glycerol-3-phosphate 1-O-acyltransferase PlsY [Clostridiales bacterium]
MMVKYILVVVIGYMIGNFASSYFVGKLMAKIDIREHGSGNAGATNIFRVLGAKAGTIVFIGDILKGILATAIGLWITGDRVGAMLAGIMAVVGHNWPVLLNFKGGKGIASSFGLIIVLFPKIALILFAVVVPLMLLTRYVSLGSITAAVLFPVLLIAYQEPLKIILLGFVVALLAILRHKDNLVRLWEGKENKISYKRSGR